MYVAMWQICETAVKSLQGVNGTIAAFGALSNVRVLYGSLIQVYLLVGVSH